MSAATVYLVGSGPGDAGLITVRGRELLERADAVVYDYLANPELLAFVPADARRVYVGKEGFAPHIGQQAINDLLVRTAREVGQRGGSVVVRLKGGDPFVFGRGGEEALALVEADVPFEVVPGVTSGIAAPAYAGVPVTHRGISSSVTFITGHEDPTKDETAIDWNSLARLATRGGTLCFYMGMRNLGLIAAKLAAGGMPRTMPVALVQWGTTGRQRTLVSTLAAVEEEAAGFGAPAIILVGEVARLRGQLTWFEQRPLLGRRIVVTRSRSQASSFSAMLRQMGAQVEEVPTIEFAPPDDFAPLDGVLRRLDRFAWVVFTSVNGVDAFFERLSLAASDAPGLMPDARALAQSRIAAIGPATAQRLREHGVKADVVPAQYRGEAVFAAMDEAAARLGVLLAGAQVLIPRAQEAREVLPRLLEEAGADVQVVAAYKTVRPSDDTAQRLVALLEAGEVDAVTFTSSSTARNLLALLGDRRDLLAGVKLFSIGPITTQTLAQAGFGDVREAAEYTIPGLARALEEHYGQMRSSE